MAIKSPPLHLISFERYSDLFALIHGEIMELWNCAPKVLGNIGHEQLIEGTKATRDAGGQADEEEQQLLVATKFTDYRQKLIQIQRVLGLD